jgi:PEP-CTERM motif
MSKILCVFATLFFVTALTPATANADPIVITSGTLSVTGLSGGPRYNLTGENFSVSGGGEQGSSTPQHCFPCAPGSSINVNGFFAGTSLGMGNAGTFILSGPTLIVPNSTVDITLTSPFVFTGHLLFCPSDCQFQPPIFTVDLVGSGTAYIDLQFVSIINGHPIFQFKSVTYDFQTPEPMSILLLGGGLLGLAAKLRRRQGWRR